MIPDLGKYATTVLAAYGSSLALLVALVAASVRSSRKSLKELQKVEGRRKDG